MCHTKDIDVVMSIYNSTIDEISIKNNGAITDVPNDPGNASFKYKQNIISQTGNDGTKNVQMVVLLKHLCNFWKTLEMPLINWKINIS